MMIKTSQKEIKRSRGGQPSNLNAVKHGFYTRHLKKLDTSGAGSTDIKGLAEEIAIIRIFTRRLIEACDSTADLYDLAGILRILCLASITITRIIKAQYFVSAGGNDFSLAIDEAIRQFQEVLEADSESLSTLKVPEIYNATHSPPSTDSPAEGTQPKLSIEET